MKKLVFFTLILFVTAIFLNSCVMLNKEPSVVEDEFYPMNGQKHLSGTVTLKWKAIDPENKGLKFDLYFGENKDSLEKVLTDTTKTSYDVNTEYNKRYYWKVVAKDDSKSIESDVFEFWTKGLELNILQYFSGGVVENAKVEFFNNNEIIGELMSDENGYVDFNYPNMPEVIDIKITKEGNAITKIENVKPELLFGKPLTAFNRTAVINTDLNQELNDLVVNFYTLDGTPISSNDKISDDFTAEVIVNENDNHHYITYTPKFDFNRVERGLTVESTKSIFTINIDSVQNGLNILHTLAYDHNENIVYRLDYVNIERTLSTLPSTPYNVVPANVENLGLPNIISFTRRRGVSYYSENNIDRGLYAAPKDSNLIIDLYWIDFDSIDKLNAALVTPPELPDTTETEKPDGYNVYRSFDGINYEKIGYVTSSYVKERMYLSALYQLLGYPNSYLKPLFSDYSAELEVGKEVWYAVSSVYDNVETEKTVLGSVIPLDTFNIILENPTDDSTGVSRNVEFKWKPDKTLSGEGTVTYNYGIFVYDWNQADNGLMIPVENVESTNAYGDIISVENSNSVSIKFTGNTADPDYGKKWYLFNPYSLTKELYPYDKLEAGKSYNWGINIAYAETLDNDSRALSIAADFRYRDKAWFIDRLSSGMEPDLHADFTTETK
ncbi:hypothetical protein [Marinitoga sp. 38H-ov]|uniref:hypothetical protein n=1 Tax=Marinitoga sp. 38H-ov TaxID=1755814 RepID=UPI0013EB05B7|nr:hypothetical protein [Marinitoga sp. 38H-ov]KAF2956125.1 hypothetical protein AS160_07085 [Marinitoga sp. 38H-ov]